MSDIVFGIKIKVDGKEVESVATVSRDQFRQIAIEAKRAGDAAAGGFSLAGRGVGLFSEQLGQAKGAILGYVSVTSALQAARWITEQASAMQQLEARLRVATASAADYAKAQAGVFQVANRYGAAIDETAKAFSRLNPVIAQMGGGADITLKMLDGLSASLKLSGATAAETSAVLLQFSQAMGSGRVGGDEFRSMMENAEPLMRAVAGQMGKTTAELRQMSEDGKLTSSVFGNALLPAIDKLSKQAAQIPLGIGQAWQVLQNNLSKDFGREFSDQASATGSAIKTLSDHTLEFAAAAHAAETVLMELARAAVVVAAGGVAAAISRNAQAAWESAGAYRAAIAAKIADAEAALVDSQATLTNTAARLAEAQATRSAAAEVLLYGPRRAAVERDLAVAMATHTAAANAAAAADQRLAAAQVEASLAGQASAAATAAGAGAAGLARGAIAALGGPVGALTFLLTAGVTAWSIWGNAAESAGDKARKVIDEALALAERREREQKFGAGELGRYREALTEIQKQLSDARWTAKSSISEAVRESAQDDIRRLEQEEMRVRKNLASAEKQADGGSPKQLSAAGEYNTLVADLKTRESLISEHQKRLLQMQTAFRDKWAGATEKERGDLSRDYTEKLKVELLKQRQELANLPLAKEASGIDLARLDADQSRLKAWYEEYKDTIKRALDESALDYQGYWALVAAGEQHLVAEEIRLAQARQAVAGAGGNRAEVIKLQGELDALRKRQSTGISAEADRGLAGDMARARSAGDNAMTDARNADAKALASAATWRRQNLSLVEQELAAAREKSALDLQERLSQLDKNEALKHAPELLDKYKEAARGQAATTLQGIEAEIQARNEANRSWEGGAKRALNAQKEALGDWGSTAARVVENFGRGFEDVWVKAATTGKFQIKDLGNVVRQELARIAYQKYIAPHVSGFLDFAADAIGKVFGVTKSAKGNVYASSDLHQYANQVVDSPILFRFAKGAALGEAGEAGPEAIMPLARGADGTLGVRVQGGSGGGVMNLNIEWINQGTPQRVVSSSQPTFDAVKGWVVRLVTTDLRDNGPMRQTMAATGIKGA